MKRLLHRRWRTISFGVMLSVTLASCASPAMKPRATVTLVGPAASVSFSVEVARDDADRQRGLMGREALGEGEGMLFVFPEQPQQRLQFWMKNTLIPLDIVFFDRGGAFVSVATMDPCVADPCPLYPSVGGASYALEVPAGTLAAVGLGNDLAPEERARWRLDMPQNLRL